MPTINVQSVNLTYHLIAFDKNGKERTDDPHGFMSQKVSHILSHELITDVFIFSHGWLGDVPEAIDQYSRWIEVMAQQTQDIERIRQIRPNFQPLLIGIHWPSLPFGGKESLDISKSVPFGAAGVPVADPIEQLVEFYSNTIADTDTAQADLRTIINFAANSSDPDVLPDNVVQAYKSLMQEANLGQDGVAGAPGDDQELFDPQQQYLLSKSINVSFGSPRPNLLLTILRLLSFWKMKDRAKEFGENGGFELLKTLQHATNNLVRFHLMGHSFGCIAVTAAICGSKAQDQLPRAVNSIALVQGALSLWSYCQDIPYQKGTPGYFHRLIKEAKVDGPILTTYSEHDTALSKGYASGAKVKTQVSFSAVKLLPKYGAVGTFGIRGDELPLHFQDMLPIEKSYAFSPGIIYNLESSKFINQRSGPGGAHNDIVKPEVAHAIWWAAMS
jgi:hypothetical protein